ncbi:hypothetical protein [Chryseobacterium sp. HR92]|uniref:hypothetical protein n=1 Tax=Chryseobacterium sp. HR92 TaxID=3094839 RepID=UPI00388F018C|nr:hypothetical protein SFA27_16855 [Chryseobacterium sp. HR92]
MENLQIPQPKVITWKELKEFVNSIPEEFINNKAHIMLEDESTARELNEPFFQEEDIYFNIDDSDDSGTLKDLTEVHNSEEDPFILDDYRLTTPKGTPFLWSY